MVRGLRPAAGSSAVIPLSDGVRPRRFPFVNVLYPESRVLGLVVVFPVRVPAWVYLGVWFLYQFFHRTWSLLSGRSGGSGVAFFAHVGGFLFGVLVAKAATTSGRLTVPSR